VPCYTLAFSGAINGLHCLAIVTSSLAFLEVFGVCHYVFVPSLRLHDFGDNDDDESFVPFVQLERVASRTLCVFPNEPVCLAFTHTP